jgi:hypothetical protein
MRGLGQAVEKALHGEILQQIVKRTMCSSRRIQEALMDGMRHVYGIADAH